MTDPQSPSPLSVGIAWAYRVTAIGLEFALPTVAGWLLDGWWGTAPLATLAGALVGFSAGLLHLIRLASVPPRRPPGPP